jgi:hypothetical protein
VLNRQCNETVHLVNQAPGGAHARLQRFDLVQRDPQAPAVRRQLLQGAQLDRHVVRQRRRRALQPRLRGTCRLL